MLIEVISEEIGRKFEVMKRQQLDCLLKITGSLNSWSEKKSFIMKDIKLTSASKINQIPTVMCEDFKHKERKQ